MAILRYPSDITSRGAYMIITRHTHDGYTTAQLKNPEQYQYKTVVGSSMGLPVPNSLFNRSSVRWNDQLDSGMLSSVASSAVNKLAQKSSTAAAVKSEVELRTGTISEKHSALLFDGVAPKTYTFSWQFLPQSAEEANMVNAIIQQFEEGKLPTLSGGGLTLESPDIFKIRFNGYKRMNFLPCVVTDVNVEDSPNGNFLVYEDGTPPMTVLTVTFNEITSRHRQTEIALRNSQNGTV